jgi:HTH-type transcriptional regulator/antitoxin HigA
MENRIKVIRTKEDHEKALELIEHLIAKDPNPDSEEGEQLNLLVTLVKDYESKTFPESLPDPIDAILFRMDQQGLSQHDLVPYIGSRSKVSEILSRKRPLTLSMMRSLQTGLGIPAKTLLGGSRNTGDDAVSWNQFPLKEMEKRGYFGGRLPKTFDVSELMNAFFRPIGSPTQCFGLLRKSNYRVSRFMDRYALLAWSAHVFKTANNFPFPGPYKPGTVDLDLMRKVAHLSTDPKGPILAQDFLRAQGIGLVVEPHFEKTYLDGATIFVNKDHPVIGMTLRHDRLDNFWFTLMHELAHISLHANQNLTFFYDDLETRDFGDEKEREADALAGEALVPGSKWEVSPARLLPSFMAANSLAKELGVHVAIVAGKMRHEGGRYVYLGKIINQAKVRPLYLSKYSSK